MSTHPYAPIKNHPIVSREQWLASRKALLKKEKELTRLRDQLSAERLQLPWVKVDKNYVFTGPNGSQTLADLFDGRSQLIIYHFMFGPDWEQGCVGCSFLSDHLDSARQHLVQHDVSLVVVARASIDKLLAYRQRMGWQFPWVSSLGSDFNHDFHVSFTKEQAATGKVYANYAEQEFFSEELSGVSVFYKDEQGNIYHTYSTYARGAESLLGTYSYLEMTPRGRNETINGNLTDWVRHHDRYGVEGYSIAPTGQAFDEKAAKADDGCCSCSK